MSNILSIFNPQIELEYYILAAIIAILVAAFCFVLMYKNKIRWYQAIAAVAIVVYIFLAFSSTVFCRPKINNNSELELFWSYKVVIENWDINRYYAKVMLKQIMLNFLLLAPVGFLFPLVVVKLKGVCRKVLASTAFCMCVSITIEVMQLVFHKGLCEFDDIIGNTFGAMIASLLCCLLIEVVRFVKRCNSHGRKM